MYKRPLLRPREDPATPALLPILAAATLAMVGAVAAIGLTDSDWADVGAVALLIGTLALVLGTMRHELRDEEPGRDRPPSGRDSV